MEKSGVHYKTSLKEAKRKFWAYEKIRKYAKAQDFCELCSKAVPILKAMVNQQTSYNISQFIKSAFVMCLAKLLLCLAIDKAKSKLS